MGKFLQGSVGALAVVATLAWSGAALGQADTAPTLENLRESVVGLRVEVSPQARSVVTLGQKRQASGVIIDNTGLIVTVGYVILEASSVEIMMPDGSRVPGAVVGYHQETGFGLVKPLKPVKTRPLTLGDSTKVGLRDPVIVMTAEDRTDLNSGLVVSRRTFTGYWEYLLENPLYVVPAVQSFAGAALLDRNFNLVGVGSLFIAEAVEPGLSIPGNLFIPIEALKPLLGDLTQNGRANTPSRPWLGLNVMEQFGRVIVTRVTKDSPAQAGGLAVGDIIFDVGGKPVNNLEEFYRTLWNQGNAGVKVPLTVLKSHAIQTLSISSGDRYQFYKIHPLY